MIYIQPELLPAEVSKYFDGIHPVVLLQINSN